MNHQSLAPVFAVDLFPDMQTALLDLLRSLSDAEWDLPTVCPGWSVKDIAQHLLGDQVGLLSGRRDGYFTPADVSTWDKLVVFINLRNDEWVRATRRLSPRLICDLLEWSGGALQTYFESLDPFAAGGAVSWAGAGPAPIWLEIAREYTEYWVHQQHIRDAVHKPGLKEPRFFAPVLAAFVRALPVTYTGVEAAEGTLVKLVIPGDAGGEWHLVREGGRWALYVQTDLKPACVVTLDAETAWRSFTKGISRDEAAARAQISGDQVLGSHLLNTVSIIA
jgi:uncharacterized protein (TIGR03083 family)